MYRFKSKADADLLMLKPVGDQILRILGRDAATQGIIEAAALPAAIRALEEAIAAAELAKRDAMHDEGEGDVGAEAVGLQQRAWPMLQMMRRSLAERADVVWGA
jgi:hypothetical protein